MKQITKTKVFEQKTFNIFIFEWTSFRYRNWNLFNWTFERYIQKNRWSLDIRIPFIHIYIEYKSPHYETNNK